MTFEDQIGIISKISIIFLETAQNFYVNFNPTLIIIEDVTPQ